MQTTIRAISKNMLIDFIIFLDAIFLNNAYNQHPLAFFVQRTKIYYDIVFIVVNQDKML